MDGRPQARPSPALKRILPLSIIGFLLLLCLAALAVWRWPGLLPRPAHPEGDVLAGAELAALRPGDIILRRAAGLPSDLVVALLNDGTGISHCALVVEGGGGEAFAVVQSVSASLSGVDGVQRQGLDAFCRVNQPGSLVVLRPAWDDAQRRRGLALADDWVARGIAFDDGFDAADSGRLYCSELLVALFRDAGWWRPEWTDYQGGLISFRTFLAAGRFRVVADHRAPDLR